ncbi:Beta sliding clamp [subsurface metagenome]
MLNVEVGRKTTITSLEYILLKDGKAVATNLETMVVTAVPEADLTSLIPFKDVTQVLRYVHGGELLHLETKDSKLSLSWAGGSATFSTEDPATFPDVPEFVPEVEESLDSDTLIPALVEILPYAARDEARPVLNGVTLILGDPVRVAAGDGYRMADKVLPLSFPKDITMIVPAGSVSVLKHLWERTPRTPPVSDELIPLLVAKKIAAVSYDGKQGLRFQFGAKTTAIVKLVNGKPPEWLKLIPKGKPSLQVQVLAPDLAVAAHRVAKVALEEKGIVRLVFTDDSVTVSAKSDGQEVSSSIATHGSEGAEGKFALGVSYLTGYLSDKQGVVTISWTGGTAPVAFQSQGSPRVLIMPMQVRWDAEEKEPEPAEKSEGEPEEEEPAAETPDTEPPEEA